MKKILILTLFLVIVGLVSAQTALEAFRYAFVNYNGTARYSAVGGAFTSLGGDITVASTNPAGLAIFRHSVGSFTPGVSINRLKGEGYSDKSTNFIFPSFGFVFTSPSVVGGSLKSVNFGFTYTQGANYNDFYHYKEANSSYTKLEEITKSLNDYNAGNVGNPILPNDLKNGGNVPSMASMAYNSGLIDYVTDAGGNKFWSPNIFAEEKVSIHEKNEMKGQSGEYAFSVAANFNDNLYVGATVGLQSIDFERTVNYDEKVLNLSNASLVKGFYDDKYLHVVGAGINFKLGAIYRVNKSLRFGLAVHTPTLFQMEEEYISTLESDLTSGKGSKKMSPTNGDYATFKYQYYTPWRFSLGGSYILGNKGFLSVDYEFIDYGSMEFSGEDFEGVNTEIKNTYGGSSNIRVGAEVRLLPQFFLRGGYNYISNMYKKNTNKEQKTSIYSGGLGYRGKSFFIDFSYQYFLRDMDSTIAEGIIVNRKHISNIAKVTLGFKF